MYICFILSIIFIRILCVLISIAYYDIRFFRIRRWQILELFLLAVCCHMAAGTFSVLRLITGILVPILPVIILNCYKKGFGRGDVLLIGVFGFLLGVKVCIMAEILAVFLSAAAILLSLLYKLLTRQFSLKQLKGTIPMAPFLCTAFCITFAIQFVQIISSIL